jgi:hypothetical protein
MQATMNDVKQRLTPPVHAAPPSLVPGRVRTNDDLPINGA